jgi:hypothetical protein
MEPGFGICAQRALEIRSRFSCWCTKRRFHEQLRWGHRGGGTKAHTGPAKPEPVYCRRIIEYAMSLTLLGETCIPKRVRKRALKWRPNTCPKVSSDKCVPQTWVAEGAQTLGRALRAHFETCFQAQLSVRFITTSADVAQSCIPSLSPFLN